jgi:peptidoglycan hydrolase-like protein with peptidoglycan-binding domain
MSERMRIQRKREKATELPSVQNDILQRNPAAPQQTVDEVPPIVQEVLSSSGQPLDTDTRAFMESRFGHDFSQVRVHTDERAVESAQAVNALAYTVGRDVAFGEGQYAPRTNEGQRVLAHELTHVVQQSSMSKGSSMTVGPVDDGFEREADAASAATVSSIQQSTQPTRLQRTIGDGHDLTSSRFAGDLTLEACYDDERYLMAGERGTIGDHGPAVEKVQQALVDLGFPLPRYGVDGKFGPETEAAVKAFQRSSGAVDDGIIGPITMGLLDVKVPRSTGKGPEIAATDEALGQKVAEDMNELNLSADFGVWYAEVYKDKVYKDKRPELWKDDYWNGYADPAYFERIAPIDWRLLPGKSASAALKSWFKGLTIAECNSSLVAIEIDTLRAAVGDDKFDEHFGSTSNVIPEANRLRIKSGTAGTPVESFMTQTEAAKTGDAGTIGARPVKVGEWYYFYNHPKFLLKHPGSDWQGENAVYMGLNDAGKQIWSGFGASNVTEQEMLNKMVAAYNGERSDRDREVLQQSFGDSPPEIYIEKYPGGEFPETITAENILNDPEYKIGDTTRKGGFVLEAGKKLDVAKVQALRNE